MDDLDLFLGELAFNSTGPESSQKKERDTANTYGQVPKVCSVGLHPRKGKEPDSTNVYSELPAPMEAGLLSPRSASRELDSIMDELLLDLEMGLPDPSPSTPPPLVQKSVKKKQIGEKKEMDDTQVKDESTNSPKTSDLERKASTHGKTDTIDDLLGGLSSDMEKMGVHTMAKGHCASCGKVIVGKMITALGQLGTIGFFEREGKDCLKSFTDGCFLELDGRPLCSLHFHSRQGTLCGGCGEPISGCCISAMERKFHPDHFVCAFCLRKLSQGVFKEQAGKPYCSACHTKLFV
uniref:LIM zinc-binding domain-containing protein n=1 Tax=Oncorhynchus tshawytscha TaxID=74940 RepID=A0A8C8MIN1_ONCTS